MSLTSGTKLGPYEIQSAIGAGGMGEVYRARDTRLERDVALKILPESFARETDRLHRFEQEARAVATLNHPNVLAIFDIGQQNGSPFLVSELLEGETLRTVLDRDSLSQRKTIARIRSTIRPIRLDVETSSEPVAVRNNAGVIMAATVSMPSASLRRLKPAKPATLPPARTNPRRVSV